MGNLWHIKLIRDNMLVLFEILRLDLHFFLLELTPLFFLSMYNIILINEKIRKKYYISKDGILILKMKIIYIFFDLK